MKRLTSLTILIAAGAVAAFAAPPLTITTTSIPAALVQQSYAPVTLQTAGDPGPIIFSYAAGTTPPPGFSVSPDEPPDTFGTFCWGSPCNAQGVQTPKGSYKFVVQAVSLSTMATTSLEYTLYVVDPLQITTTSPLPSTFTGQAYSKQLQATGGTGQFSWSVAEGVLPPGIVLDAVTGGLAGAATGATATYMFTIRVLDQATQLSALQTFTIDVTQGSPSGLAITTIALPNGTVNQPYSLQLQGTGGQNLVWSVQQGSGSQLPPQFSLSPSGLLTGFGIFTGKFVFTIQLADAQVPGTATKQFTFYITLGPLGIEETALRNATQNVAYSTALTPIGGLPPYSWALGGTEPPGLTIDPGTGTLSGTLRNAGNFDVPVKLTDATGAVFSRTFTLIVGKSISITTVSLPNASPGVPYITTLTAVGSIPFIWSVSAGSLPPGMTLDSVKGQIIGTSNTQGVFPFTIQVTESATGGTATKAFTIAVGQVQPLTITTTTLPDAGINQSYQLTLAATGGIPPYIWALATGTLPPGLQLDAATGVISGKPTTIGKSTFAVTATDAQQNVARQTLTLNVGDPANPLVITTGDFTGTVGTPFLQTLTATGGTTPYTWSAASLPSGLSLNTVTGVITGTLGAPGTTPVIFTVTDANGQAKTKTINFTVTIPPAPVTSISLGTTTQQAVGLSTDAPFPLEISGALTLKFASSVGSSDGGEVRFSNGTRSLDYIIRPNTTQAIFPTANNPAILPGTVAGTITVTASLAAGGQDITPGTPPTKTIVIDSAVPVISSVTLQQVSGGLNVVVTGYSNTREVSSGSFTFTVSGSAISPITVPLTSAYAAWFGSTSSNSTGGQFKLTVPFTVSQGSATAVTKVSVTLTNSKGTSAASSSP